MGTRAATYCRISDDKAGQRLGVDDQRMDCAALAERLGWTVVEIFVDNDVSASKGAATLRPDYERLMRGVREGDFDAIVAVHPERLHRNVREQLDFIDDVRAARIPIQTVRAGLYDVTTTTGRMAAIQVGAVSQYYAENLRDLVLRAMERNAARGVSHGRISFGWRREVDPENPAQTREVIEPDQADIVREIAARIIAGDSLTGIVKDLIARGVPTPTSAPWTKSTIRGLVLRERNVGQRVHKGKVVGAGAWGPILDKVTFTQVTSILHDPARRTSSGSAAVHLLSGIGRCGTCGQTLRASMNGTVPIYRCFPGGHVGRKRSDVDAFVTATIVTRLERADAAALMVPKRRDDVERAVAEATKLRAKLDLVADEFALDKMDIQQFERMTARLRPQLADAESRSRVVDDLPLLDGLVGVAGVAAKWEALPLSRKRALVDLLVEVRVLPTRRGAQSFDPDAVEVEWKALG